MVNLYLLLAIDYIVYYGNIVILMTYRNTRVKSEKIVTKFGESLNLVMFLVNISVKNDKQLKLLKKVIILFQFV